MIDPNNITNFNRTNAELQEFLLFCVVVAGKKSDQQSKKLWSFLESVFNNEDEEMTPFQKLKYLFASDCFDEVLQESKLGQYTRIKKAFYQLLALDPQICTLEELEAVEGVGPKTARFFLLHSRPNQEFAVLDTHVLKFLSSLGFSVPKATPPKKLYGKIESWFLDYARALNLRPADLDLTIWKSFANNAL